MMPRAMPIALAAVMLLFTIVLGHAHSSNCTGSGAIYSQGLLIEVNGNQIRMYPLASDGSKVQNFVNLSLQLTEVTERNKSIHDELGILVCDQREKLGDRKDLLQSLNVSDMRCTVTYSTSHPDPSIFLEQITINYTHPSYPNFTLSASFFVTNASYNLYPSNDTTHVDPGKIYRWTFEYVHS